MSDAEVEVLGAGRWVRLVRRGHWEYVERTRATGIVMLVAVTPEGRLLLVEQYRPPVAAAVVELPAGLVGDDAGREHEPLLEGARRELIEETGYDAAHLEVVASGAPSAGLSAEVLAVVVARDLRRVGPGGGDHAEDIVVHEVPVAEVEAWLATMAGEGRVIDLKVYAGLYFARDLGGTAGR